MRRMIAATIMEGADGKGLSQRDTRLTISIEERNDFGSCVTVWRGL